MPKESITRMIALRTFVSSRGPLLQGEEQTGQRRTHQISQCTP
jgi:hypothetical protein